MLEDIQAAIPLGFLLSIMIGPVFFVLLETSATKGFRAGLFFDFGVILADILFLTIAYFSSFQLLENLSNQPGLYVFGGGILLVYGIYTIFNKEVRKTEAKIKTRKSDYFSLFIKGFFLNFINIGVLVFWLGMIIIVSPNLNNEPRRMLIFFGSVLAVYLMVDLFKILLAKQLRNKLTKDRIRLMKKGLGIVLVICGLVLIVKGFFPLDQLNIENRIDGIHHQ